MPCNACRRMRVISVRYGPWRSFIVRGRWSEVGGQRSEVRGQRRDGGQRSEPQSYRIGDVGSKRTYWGTLLLSLTSADRTTQGQAEVSRPSRRTSSMIRAAELQKDRGQSHRTAEVRERRRGPREALAVSLTGDRPPRLSCVTMPAVNHIPAPGL